MHLEVSFRNLRARDEIRRRGQALYDKLSRFLDPAAEGHLILNAEHGVTQVELIVTTRGQTHTASDEDEDLRTALDRTFHTIETSLRRAKERRIDRRRRRGADKPDGFEGGDDVEGEEEASVA